MSGRMDAGDSYTSDDDTGKLIQGSVVYVLGVSCTLILLIIIIYYVSYKGKRSTGSRSPPDDEDHQLRRVSGGVGDDVLITLPVFAYSEDTIPHKGDTATDATGSGCSVCLVDYKPANIIRLLPKCGHLFHRKCIDTWLKVHATCPVCRNSPLPVHVPIGNGTTIDVCVD
ncbi:hypothetical protein L2E82_32744 [Cichorium intybus]|uniref:Uncharacterized protein n=1 Tax=Cichorium intybus TaxID=13427 RepID=A0ACB9BIK2_CICIN|nr:hypothetical protein L2E82_32744 [Cichorium intybus]